MHRLRASSALPLCLGLLISSCSGSQSINPTDYEARSTVASCTRSVHCGVIGKSEEAQCLADGKAAATLYPSPYDIEAAVKAGRVLFDAQKAEVCIKAQAEAGCTLDGLFASFEACEGVYTGAVPPGGACQSDGECKGGYCERPSSEDGCAGTCVAYDARGAACNPNDSHCSDDDYCDQTSKVCTARGAIGEPCGGGPRCRYELYCKGYVAAAQSTPEKKGACQQAGKVGEPCQIYFFGNTDCDPTLFCDDSQSTPVCATRLGLGAACTGFNACQDGLLCLGLTYDRDTGDLVAEGKCSANLDVGSTCDPAANETGCPYASTTCDETTKTCKVTGKLGSDCSESYCDSNLYCEPAGSTCAQQIPLGGTCTPPGKDGENPCHDGECDPATKVCALMCT